MASFSRSLETSASPQTVWRLWSDPLKWNTWNPSVNAISLQGPFAPGTEGTMTSTTRTHPIRIESVDEGRAFSLAAKAIPLTTLHFRCEVAPSGSGSRISQGVSITGPMAWLAGPMMGDRIAQTFEAVLQGLKQKAEAQPTS